MGEVIQAVLVCALRATTKKVVNFFGEEECTPRQNPGYADVHMGPHFDRMPPACIIARAHAVLIHH